MQATYDTFVEKAAAGRNTTPERIDAIAQGRVWTGKQAKQLGLVDELGGLDRALAIAKQRAKLAPDSEVELVVYPGTQVDLRHREEPVRQLGADRRARRAARDPRSARAADAHGPAARLPPRRAARDHAECVREVTGPAKAVTPPISS